MASTSPVAVTASTDWLTVVSAFSTASAKFKLDVSRANDTRTGRVGRLLSDGSNGLGIGIGIANLVVGSMIDTCGLAGPSALKLKVICESTFVSGPIFIVSAGCSSPSRLYTPQ